MKAPPASAEDLAAAITAELKKTILPGLQLNLKLAGVDPDVKVEVSRVDVYGNVGNTTGNTVLPSGSTVHGDIVEINF
jgi:ethanolamine ammonia-lyase small subunit